MSWIRTGSGKLSLLSPAGGPGPGGRLAALAARPGVLADGLSPAPLVIADLLIGLREAGAGSVSAAAVRAVPAKELRAFERRGQDWYCAACFNRRLPVQCLRPGAARGQPGQGRSAGAAGGAPTMTG